MVLLPGGRLAARNRSEAARAALAGSWLFGPRAWRVSRVARTGNRPLLHRLEREWGERAARALGIKWDVDGLEHVAAGRRTIVLPLHEGFADVLPLLRLGLDLRFVARQELLEWPTLGRYLRNSEQVLIEPERGRSAYRSLLTRGPEVLGLGEALVVFPQGSILGIEVAFSRVAFRLAEQLDAWILPVALTGSHRVWEYPYSPLMRFGQPMSMRVFPAVPPHRAVDEAAAIEDRLKQAALDGSMAGPRRFRPEADGFWDGYPYEIDPRFPELADQVAAHRKERDR